MTPRLRSTLPLLAIGLAACLGPGSGGGPGNGASPGSKTGFGASDPGPFSGTSDPGGRPSPPGASPDGRPGPQSAAGSVCDEFCAVVYQCVGGYSTCLDVCRSVLPSSPCMQEIAGFLQCAADFVTCDTKKQDKEDSSKEDDFPLQVDEGALNACKAEYQRLAHCEEANEQGTGGSGGSGGMGAGGSKAGSAGATTGGFGGLPDGP